MTFSIVLALWWLWQQLISWLGVIILAWRFRHSAAGFRCPSAEPEKVNPRFQPKPEWVAKEVIRLKALMPHDGSRKVSEVFNRLHEQKNKMTVGKTWVCEAIKKHRYEIQVLRRHIKHRKPRPMPKNLIWQLDLTQVRDEENQPHTLFGVLDSGSRACLHLRKIRTKASLTLITCLFQTIERYGKPKIVRTDNEGVFVSKLFRFGLWLLDIKHQRTEVCCPWQNGKVERFFGTLKDKLKHYQIPAQQLADELAFFRTWYNHVRVHQHLDGKTPAEVWNRRQVNPYGKALYFQAWDKALTGFYLRPT